MSSELDLETFLPKDEDRIRYKDHTLWQLQCDINSIQELIKVFGADFINEEEWKDIKALHEKLGAMLVIK